MAQYGEDPPHKNRSPHTAPTPAYGRDRRGQTTAVLFADMLAEFIISVERDVCNRARSDDRASASLPQCGNQRRFLDDEMGLRAAFGKIPVLGPCRMCL